MTRKRQHVSEYNTKDTFSIPHLYSFLRCLSLVISFFPTRYKFFLHFAQISLISIPFIAYVLYCVCAPFFLILNRYSGVVIYCIVSNKFENLFSITQCKIHLLFFLFYLFFRALSSPF